MNAAMQLKQLVEERGVTYTFLSNKTGISVDAISKNFMGKRRMLADEMISICAVMGINLNDLRGTTLESHPQNDMTSLPLENPSFPVPAQTRPS